MKDKDKIWIEGEMRNAFSTSSSLLDANIDALMKHIARIAAEDDYKKLQQTGKIPYSSFKQKENDYE